VHYLILIQTPHELHERIRRHHRRRRHPWCRRPAAAAAPAQRLLIEKALSPAALEPIQQIDPRRCAISNPAISLVRESLRERTVHLRIRPTSLSSSPSSFPSMPIPAGARAAQDRLALYALLADSDAARFRSVAKDWRNSMDFNAQPRCVIRYYTGKRTCGAHPRVVDSALARRELPCPRPPRASLDDEGVEVQFDQAARWPCRAGFS